MANTIKINGMTITTGGKSIVVNNGKVIVDGKPIGLNKDDKVFKIEVHGDVDVLDVDVCEYIKVVGNVGDVKTSQGDIDIEGDVMDTVTNSQGNIKIGGDLNGNAKNSMGSIKAGGDIFGDPKTSMGDIKGKKIYRK